MKGLVWDGITSKILDFWVQFGIILLKNIFHLLVWSELNIFAMQIAAKTALFYWLVFSV